MGEIDELVREFIDETTENLDSADRDLIELERDPDPEQLDNLFRTIHTIKGTCGFLGYETLGELAHGAEGVLNLVRGGELRLDTEIASALLAAFDNTREFISCLSEGRATEDAIDEAVVRELERLISIEPPSDPDDDAAPVSDPSDDHSEAGATPPGPLPMPTSSAEPVHMDTGTGKLRVDVELVDRLMDLVGELVLTRNQMMTFAHDERAGELTETVLRLDHVTTELQARVMRTRMQPISTIWSKVPRLVRDLAVQCGKRVRLHVEGTDTELDKTVIEAIRDPLVHMIRNSVDHGIEAPDDRVLLGKPADGNVWLSASHEGGQVNIEIRDDGRGLDVGVIRDRAIERQLIDLAQADAMSEDDLIKLIFLPGFSTARSITTLSGRGVGMDVVRTNIESIGGSVDLTSRPGEGTTVKIQIPLTLAIVPALIVENSSERFAIPQVHLRELVSMVETDDSPGIEMVHGVPVYRLRDRLLPLVWLTKELGQDDRDFDQETIVALQRQSQLVVLDAGGQWFGLIVDRVGNPEEIVVKPLGEQLSSIPIYSGASIMGDGSVALILDVLGLAHQANILLRPDQLEGAASEEITLTESEVEELGVRSYLVVKVCGERRVAMPLDAVTRLESLPRSAVEQTSSGTFVQYRGEVMPVHSLAEMIGSEIAGESDVRSLTPEAPVEAVGPGARDEVPVIVSSRGPRVLGVLVDKILDVVRRDIVVRDFSDRPGVIGSTILADRVTELVDLHALLDTVYADDLSHLDLMDQNASRGRRPVDDRGDHRELDLELELGLDLDLDRDLRRDRGRSDRERSDRERSDRGRSNGGRGDRGRER